VRVALALTPELLQSALFTIQLLLTHTSTRAENKHVNDTSLNHLSTRLKSPSKKAPHSTRRPQNSVYTYPVKLHSGHQALLEQHLQPIPGQAYYAHHISVCHQHTFHYHLIDKGPHKAKLHHHSLIPSATSKLKLWAHPYLICGLISPSPRLAACDRLVEYSTRRCSIMITCLSAHQYHTRTHTYHGPRPEPQWGTSFHQSWDDKHDDDDVSVCGGLSHQLTVLGLRVVDGLELGPQALLEAIALTPCSCHGTLHAVLHTGQTGEKRHNPVASCQHGSSLL
jgi:hypothetical protein